MCDLFIRAARDGKWQFWQGNCGSCGWEGPRRVMRSSAWLDAEHHERCPVKALAEWKE